MNRASRRQRQWLARLVLLSAALIGGGWLASLDFDRKISTNVLDLLPADERQPELHLLRTLVNETQARVVWAVLRTPSGDAPAAEAVEEFVRVARADPALVAVERVQGSGASDELGVFLFEHRFDYLLPEWLAAKQMEYERTADGAEVSGWSEWLAARVTEDLDAFLTQPESGAFEELVLADPLLLVPQLAADAAELGMAGADDRAVIWIRAAASPLEDAGQQPVAEAIALALRAAQGIDPTLEVDWTGVGRFAEASKAKIRRELSILNLVSLSAVLVVAWLLMRRPWRLLHLLPIVLLSLLGAWVTVLTVFDRVHVLVFVLGALLSGAAIDYGFHLGVHAARVGSLRPVLKALFASCLTTVLGFSLLATSELPLLRHLGVFVSGGLLCALGAALLYFWQLDDRCIEPRSLPALPNARRQRSWLIALGILAAVGVARLQWHDDIRELEVPTPALQENDHLVRAQVGDTEGRTAYLVHGSTFDAARQRLATLREWHRHQYPDTPLVGPPLLLPSRAAFDALPSRLAALGGFLPDLRAALEAKGFDAGEFRPFFSAWTEWTDAARPSYDSLLTRLRAVLPGPLADSIGVAPGQAWLVVVAAHGTGPTSPAIDGVSELNQLRSLNGLFTRYRTQALRLSLIGLGLLAVSVCVLYGARRGLGVFVLPASACFVVFGLFGWFGHTVNLFHLLAAFLGVCLSHDYAIFSREHRIAGKPPPLSIRLSALTTAASFGVLAFSQIPAVAALGLTVTLIVLVALISVELSDPA